MASKVSSMSNLPWTWAIEALSCSSKVDASLLIDIVKCAPEISDDLEKNVREVVTLKILESLSIEENQIKNNETPAQGQKAELDPSNRAEDVLRRILEEMSATDTKIVGPEVLNWDVQLQSFIVHKRTSFPKCALQKLKEAILKGGHSVLESLKEKSGLEVRTQCDNNTSVNLGNSNCLPQRLGESSGEICENGDEESEDDLPDRNLVPAKTNTAATSDENWGTQSYEDQIKLDDGSPEKFKQDSSREISENGDEESEDDLPDRNLVPAKTNMAATSGENRGTQSYEDQIKLDDGSTEKFKQDSNISEGTVVQNSIGSSSHWQSTNASEGFVQYIERDRFHLQNEVKVGSSTPQNRDDRLEVNFENVYLLPAKKSRDAVSSDNLKRLCYEGKTALDDGYDSHAEASKKIKQGTDFVGQNGVENQITSRTNASEETLHSTEREAHNLQLVVKVGASTPQNRDSELQGTVPDRNLLPSKRNRVIVTAEKSGDSFDSHAEAAKKFKQDMNVTGDNLVENPISSPIHGIMTISSDMIIEDIHTGKCNLEKEAPSGAVEYNGSPRDNEYQNAAPKRLSQSHDGDDHLPSPLGVEVNDNKVAEFSAGLNCQKNGVDGGTGHHGYLEPRKLNNRSSVGMEKEICPKNAINGFEGNFPRNASNGGEAKDDMVYSPDLEMTSDSDEYNDNRIDAALKKDALLCSQCTYSQDSYATQSNSCIKCNGDGELLVCSSNTCQLVVHKSCLRSAGIFDENGKFYCPFCAYSRSISEYLQVKRKASLARKHLAMFIGVKTDCQPKKSTLTSDGAKQSQLKRNGEFGIDNEGNVDEELMNRASKSHCLDNMENRNQTEPPESYYCGNPLCGKKKFLTDGTAHGSAQSNLERLDMGQQLQSPGGNLEQLRASGLVKKSDNVCRNTNLVDRNEKNREMRCQKIQDIPKSTLPLEPLCGSNTENSEEDDEKFATSRYSKRLRHPVIYNDPAIPQLRRKALPWSEAEEEKLKEGVQRLCSIHDQKIPWTKILEFGAEVFQRGRTAVDLKDKWRNMCRGSPVQQ